MQAAACGCGLGRHRADAALVSGVWLGGIQAAGRGCGGERGRHVHGGCGRLHASHCSGGGAGRHGRRRHGAGLRDGWLCGAGAGPSAKSSEALEEERWDGEAGPEEMPGGLEGRLERGLAGSELGSSSGAARSSSAAISGCTSGPGDEGREPKATGAVTPPCGAGAARRCWSLREAARFAGAATQEAARQLEDELEKIGLRQALLGQAPAPPHLPAETSRPECRRQPWVWPVRVAGELWGGAVVLCAVGEWLAVP